MSKGGEFRQILLADGYAILGQDADITAAAADTAYKVALDGIALDGITLAARRGEMICVIGPSGCGKSTLLRVLSGQLEPTQGQVGLNGFPLYQHH